MSKPEQLPLPVFAPILWPTGPASLGVTLLECMRIRREQARRHAGPTATAPGGEG